MAGGSFCWIQWKISELEALMQDVILKNKQTPPQNPKQTKNKTRWGSSVWAYTHGLYQLKKCHDNSLLIQNHAWIIPWEITYS